MVPVQVVGSHCLEFTSTFSKTWIILLLMLVDEYSVHLILFRSYKYVNLMCGPSEEIHKCHGA